MTAPLLTLRATIWPLHWVHTFGGLLPALWGCYCCLWGARLVQQWLWLQGLSITLAGSFWELHRDLRLFLPNFPSFSLPVLRSQTCISLWNLTSLAPSPCSPTGISPVTLSHTQSCLLLGEPMPTNLGHSLEASIENILGSPTSWVGFSFFSSIWS